MFTVAEGEIGEMHIGLKGTMNALLLKDLRLKTHRGLQGQGSRPPNPPADPEMAMPATSQLFAAHERGGVSAGNRLQRADEADIVRRIFREFVDRLNHPA